ncbi:MAG: lysine--tRNA ligase [Chloroflexi bacterium]|nr:lysine--tRNA ligase [Chloroflexota bacterium]|tara:strand:- start:10761 stop:12254 length:1494 start_codon:yes stop_codon:yes gene_type:complete
MPQRGDELLASRRAKLERLIQRGIDPFPARFKRTHNTKSASEAYIESEQTGVELQGIALAGRVTRIRRMGKASFIDIDDSEGRLQLLARSDLLSESYSLIDDIDLGDFIGASGNLIRTKTGEISLSLSGIAFLGKALRPPPEKFHGLRDIEQRYRQRYLDLMSNRDVHSAMRSRSQIITKVRSFFDQRGYLEVDTPVLVPVPAGAMAQPFVTRHNALDRQLYLRIATELYLKRLIVGGMDKVYEIGRVFRNEGIDADHNPEFTLLESYEAYADYQDIMELVEQLVPFLATEVFGSTKVNYGDYEIGLDGPWPRISLQEALVQYAGIDLNQYLDARSLADQMGVMGVPATYAESRGRLIDKLVGTYVEPNLIQPTFLVDYPVEMSPLAKASRKDPRYAERFEAFAAGMEIANSYTELNDPDVQRQRLVDQEDLRKQYQGEELDRMDEDFLIALEHGMPPTGGLGIGIDRLIMILTGQQTIRDVMLFPQVRQSDEGKND